MKITLPNTGLRVLLGLSLLLHIPAGHCLAAAPENTASAPAIRELFAKLALAERASTLEAQRRDIPAAMHALLDAPKDVLLEAVTRDLSSCESTGKVLITHCAQRYPEETIAKLPNSSVVWSAIARTDPERAIAQAPTVSKNNTRHRPRDVAKAVGKAWFTRDGVAAIKKMETLPDPDPVTVAGIYEGMCEAATDADDCLALLDWLAVNPRFMRPTREGDEESWWIVPMRKAVTRDPTRARKWLEHTFPPGPKRNFKALASWNVRLLRYECFYVWAKSNPREAADWYVAQFPEDTPDLDLVLSSCLDVLIGPDQDITPGLVWLEQFRDKAVFVAVAALELNRAASELRNDTHLTQVTKWMTTLPPEKREQIIRQSRKDYDSQAVPFAATMDDKILRGAFPDETQRRTALNHFAKTLAQVSEKEAYDNGRPGNEFSLTHHKPVRTVSGEASKTAETLARQYCAAFWAHSPGERLEAIAVLDWLPTASPKELRDVLSAHLESNRASSHFAEAIIKVWRTKEWRGCEQFAWDTANRDLLVETYKAAASKFPDQVYARLQTLAEEKRFDPESLARDYWYLPEGGTTYMGYVPKLAGAAWIEQDGAKAIEKFKALPRVWLSGAIDGAVQEFDDATAGLALLDFLDAAGDSLHLMGGIQLEARESIAAALRRLADIDPNSARQWLKAKPGRETKFH